MRHSPSERTYRTFVIHQILPPLGWQAVFVEDGAHVASPVALLALVTRRQRLVRTRAPVEAVYATGAETEEEGREVVALHYCARGDTGFNPCDELDNYCGLLPPETTLSDFLKDHQCPCQRPTTEARYHPANPFFDLPVAEADKGARS